MGTQDHDRLYSALADPAAVVQTPNTVSRHIKVGDRAFTTGVQESGKIILDAELQLHQDAAWWESFLLKGWQIPSGWLRGQNRGDSYDDFILEVAPASFNDSTGGTHIIWGTPPIPDWTLLNAIILPKIEAVVAGHPIVVEYTNTTTDGGNLIVFDPPPSPADTPPVFKRTDFVFLEVWLALVAPSPVANGVVVVNVAADITAGDQVIIDGVPVTATAGVPGPGQFQFVPGDENLTASNLAAAISATVGTVTTSVSGSVVTVWAATPGAAGNAITTSAVVITPGCITVPAATLAGGEDRPNKPSQATLYRHGNVLSPLGVALADEFLDPRLKTETSQRVQVQYRIRVTGSREAVDYKAHPDGFSNGGVWAQGAGPSPVPDYPFVPANRTAASGNSSAIAYGIQDDGLWIAGDGSAASAQDLGTVDGYVYAIPLCFVFRHNDASDAGVLIKGFDPVANANGAPSILHTGYTGVTGPVGPSTSDRPDGEFCDVIGMSRILDLRRHVVFPGQDFAGEVAYQIQSLLDGTNRTWAVDTADKQWLGDTSGDVSTNFLVCNEIGRQDGFGSSPPTSGDTRRGVCIRNFDHIARRFSDQPVIERVVFSFFAGDRRVAPAFGLGTVNPGKYVTKASGSPLGAEALWYEGDTLVLDLTNLNATGLSCLFDGRDGGSSDGGLLPGTSVSWFAPPGTVITDILSMYHDEGHSVTPVDQTVKATMITGLGTPVLTVTLDANPQIVDSGGIAADHSVVGSGGAVDGSPRRIFLEVEITYPIGVGATDTPTETLVPDPTVYDSDTDPTDIRGPGPKIENDITQRPGDYSTPLPPRFREGYREIQLEYSANNTNNLFPDTNPVQDVLISRSATEIVLPRRILTDTDASVYDITMTAHAINTSATEFGSSSRLLSIAGDPLPAAQSACQVTYWPQDPIPNWGPLGGGYQVAVYYRADSPQTAGVMSGGIDTAHGGTLPLVLRVEPLMVGGMYAGQTGMGSVDIGFPYSAPLDQIPINEGSAMVPPITREWFFCATADISVSDFNAATGLLTLHPMVQADVQNLMVFGNDTVETRPRRDAEFRAFYPMADLNTYRPTVISQPLTGLVRHKAFVPILVRAVEEVPCEASGGLLFRRNELLLVVLSRFVDLNDTNAVTFATDPTNNRTCAALYRTRNLLIVVGDRSAGPIVVSPPT